MGVYKMHYSAVAKRWPLGMLLGTGLTIAATQVASAQFAPVSPPASLPAQPILKNTLAYKAPPDECFALVSPVTSYSPLTFQNGQPYQGSTADHFYPNPPALLTCPKGSQPKVNPAYVWGLTQTGSHVWFGTTSSGDCLTRQGQQSPTAHIPGVLSPSYVCEFDNRMAPPITVGYGDWQPPKIFHYDTNTRKVTEYSS